MVLRISSLFRARSEASNPGSPDAEPPFNESIETEQPRQAGSLFGEILDWMFAPLLLIWPMSVAITYIVAKSISNAPFDRALEESVQMISLQMRESQGQVELKLPIPAKNLLRPREDGKIYYQVWNTQGKLIEGDKFLPQPTEENAQPGTTRLRTVDIRGVEIRIAHQWIEYQGASHVKWALVQVGETNENRTELANEIIKGVIFPQFVVLPLAVLLSWFGLSQGLRPLRDIQRKIRTREPNDLRPIDLRQAPEEIAPLVDSFNELLARLSISQSQQRRFVADAAHQLKTPLAGLKTQAELACRENSPAELQRSLRQIAERSDSAAHLVNQLLAMARAESPPGHANSTVDLTPLARGVVQDFVPQAMQRNIDLGFETALGDEPLNLDGDPLLLREMLRNLVDNALRYTPAGGQVTVRLGRARGNKGAPWVEIEDNGPGIPESERDLVFERFYRVLGTGIEGSGLGLSIVREIALRHRATIDLRQTDLRPDHGRSPGLTFRIQFPSRAKRSENSIDGPIL